MLKQKWGDRSPDKYSLSGMKKLRHNLILAFGLTLTLGALVGIYYWHYRTAPLRNITNPQWCYDHSEKEIWEEQQKNYQRTNSPPDTFFRGDRIGQYGDKQWLIWLIDNIEEGMPCCGCGLGALAYMTNHNFDDPQDYVRWFKEHRSKSQESIIQLGFEEYGVMVSKPLKQSEIDQLLQCLGNDQPEESQRIPGNVKYNAFRWLRDSGFKPVPYMRSNKNIRKDKQLENGMYVYLEYLDTYPRANGLGRLNVAKNEAPDNLDELSPTKATPSIIVNSLIAVTLALGLLTITHSLRTKLGRSHSAIPPAPSTLQTNTTTAVDDTEDGV